MSDFCSLPREVVHLILDRMPVRDAARTTILSREWRYIWSQHTNLVFDKIFFNECFSRKSASLGSCANAITEILLLRNGPVSKFHLVIPSTDSQIDWDKHIHQWLSYLSRNGIQEIMLIGDLSRPCKLPSNSFCFPRLKHLKLSHCLFRPPNAFGWFHNLISLHLIHMNFASELFSDFVLHAPQLVQLVVGKCTGIEHFKVNAPNLDVCILFLSSDVNHMSLHSSPSLNYLSIVLPEKDKTHGQAESFDLKMFLDKCPRTKHLRLNRLFLELLDAVTISLVSQKSLNNLTHIWLLDFQFSDQHQMSRLMCFLRSCTNLTGLSIWASAEGSDAEETDASSWDKSQFQNDRFKTLKSLAMFDMNGTRTELHFLKYILATTPLLETISVNYSKASKGPEFSFSAQDVQSRVVKLVRVTCVPLTEFCRNTRWLSQQGAFASFTR